MQGVCLYYRTVVECVMYVRVGQCFERKCQGASELDCGASKNVMGRASWIMAHVNRKMREKIREKCKH